MDIKFPVVIFKENRKRLIQHFNSLNISRGVIYLEGNEVTIRNGDTSDIFRQDSNFQWLSGFDVDSSSIVIDFVNNRTTIFYKPINAVWDGRSIDRESIMRDYEVDDAQLTTSLDSYFKERLKENDVIYCLDKKHRFNLDRYQTNKTILKPALLQLRSVKTNYEIQLMKLTSEISSGAHIQAMKEARVGQYEYYLEAVFQFTCAKNGSKVFAYQPIVGSGYNSSILHYTRNNRKIENGDLILIDAGNELFQYGTDITRTFPANGKFNSKQRLIYSIVLQAFKSSILLLKPGALWPVIATSCKRQLASLLLQYNFLKGNLDNVHDRDIISTFMPHGLGHFVGLDVHDTYIFPNEPLKVGNVITIEPGIYFNEDSLRKAYNDPNKKPFINWDMVEEFKDFGGVRIEDTLVITENGSETLVKVPVEIEDIEKIMLKN